MAQDAKDRDYKKEYERDHASPTQKKNRAQRNSARSIVKKKLGSEAVKGKDVDHKTPITRGGTNTPSNLRVMSIRKNRGRNN